MSLVSNLTKSRIFFFAGWEMEIKQEWEEEEEEEEKRECEE